MNVRALPLLAVLALTGCYVASHKNGGKDNVDIGTPFGSMHVKTDPNKVVSGLGLAVYPGSVATKESNGKDDNSADVNMDFGDFHLGVKAATYWTKDSPEKVEAFYRKELAHYGTIIKCKGEKTVGQPDRTEQGLTCKDSDKGDGKVVYTHTSDRADDPGELRAGSPQHQHIVGMERKDGGTKIGLVALDLPGHMSFHTSKDSE